MGYRYELLILHHCDEPYAPAQVAENTKGGHPEPGLKPNFLPVEVTGEVIGTLYIYRWPVSWETLRRGIHAAQWETPEALVALTKDDHELGWTVRLLGLSADG